MTSPISITANGVVEYRWRRGRGVSNEGDGMTDHRALAGWISHSLFVIETPPSGGHAGSSYGAFSMGNTTGSNPDVLVDSSAT